MTMSQRSSGSPRAPVTEDERLLTPTPHAERRGFTRTDPWRGLGVLLGGVRGVVTPPHRPHAPPTFGPSRAPPPRPISDRSGRTGPRVPRPRDHRSYPGGSHSTL